LRTTITTTGRVSLAALSSPLELFGHLDHFHCPEALEFSQFACRAIPFESD